jgi:hypothetical protein
VDIEFNTFFFHDPKFLLKSFLTKEIIFFLKKKFKQIGCANPDCKELKYICESKFFNVIQLDIIEIADLKAQIVVLKTTIANLENQVKALTGTIEILDVKVASLIEENMFLQEQVFVNDVTNTQNLLGLSETIDVSLNTLFSYLKRVDINPDVIYEKVNYREIEHEKLHNINKVLDILFYSFYCAFLLIMVCMGNIKREHFLIYLIIGLIPIVYPFLFKLIGYLMSYISTNSYGPKNAFIDINNTIYAYNI